MGRLSQAGRRARCAIVVACLLPATAHADEPLKATAPATIVADGRTLAPIVVTGGAARARGELAWAPERPFVACANAMVFPAVAKKPPAVLASVSQIGKTLSCTVTHRGLSAAVHIKVVAPPPGLYASAPVRVLAGTRQVRLDAVSVDRGRIAPAIIKRARASQGKATIGSDGSVSVRLPKGKAPRMIAVVVSDGKRTAVGFVQVIGRARLPVKVERRSTVSVRVAGWWSKPLLVRGRRAKVRIEVAPGVRGVVVRSKRRGTIIESQAELPRPAATRLAAMALTPTVEPNGILELVVGIADRRARPAASDVRIGGSAKRGKIVSKRRLGNGLWRVRYRAPKRPGRDRVKIWVDDRNGYRSARVYFRIVLGGPARIRVVMPASPIQPGQELTGTVVATDRADNALPRQIVTGTLGRQPITVTRRRGQSRWSVRAPMRLPPDKTLRFEWRTGTVAVQTTTVMRPGKPSSAHIRARVGARSATAVVVVRDVHGNVVAPADFRVDARGGSRSALTSTAGGVSTRIAVADNSRTVVLTVRSGARTLATRTLRFAANPSGLRLGVWAGGGWLTNAGDLQSALGSAGLGLRRRFGPVELALLIGAERFAATDQAVVAITGIDRMVERTVIAQGASFGLRARLGLSSRFGASLSALVVPRSVRVRLASDFQNTLRFAELVVGARAQLAVDVRVWQGRAFLGASLSQAKLSDPVVRGTIEAASFVAGYEWWFANLGL